MLNFSNFTAAKAANTKPSGGHRTGATGQSFNFRFKAFLSTKNQKEGEDKVQDSFFQVSDKLFAEMGLDTNGLLQVISPEGVSYLAVVDNKHALLLRRTAKNKEGAEKGKKFKSTIVEDALTAQGVIDKSLIGVSQKLELTKVSDATTIGKDAIPAIAVYEVSKSEDASGEDDDKGVEETVPVADATVAETTPEAIPEVEAETVPVTEASAPAAPASDDDF